MMAAGQEQLFDLSVHAVLGLVEVIKQYFKFRQFMEQVVQLARREQPDAVVLIDSSGFNLRLAPRVKKDVPGDADHLLREPAGVGLARGAGAGDDEDDRFAADDFALRAGVVRGAGAEIQCALGGAPGAGPDPQGGEDGAEPELDRAVAGKP